MARRKGLREATDARVPLLLRAEVSKCSLSSSCSLLMHEEQEAQIAS